MGPCIIIRLVFDHDPWEMGHYTNGALWQVGSGAPCLGACSGSQAWSLCEGLTGIAHAGQHLGVYILVERLRPGRSWGREPRANHGKESPGREGKTVHTSRRAVALHCARASANFDHYATTVCHGSCLMVHAPIVHTCMHACMQQGLSGIVSLRTKSTPRDFRLNAGRHNAGLPSSQPSTHRCPPSLRPHCSSLPGPCPPPPAPLPFAIPLPGPLCTRTPLSGPLHTPAPPKRTSSISPRKRVSPNGRSTCSRSFMM